MLLDDFAMSIPLVAAPMSGGPTTPQMVIAAARAGGLGTLAAGYKTVGDLEAQIAQVSAEGIAFGVNVFAPNPLPVDRDAYRRYAALIRQRAERFGVELPPEPIEDTDGYDAKIDLLLDDPVPMVSFTFGIPAQDVIARLRHAGSVVAQTVTTGAEAARAQAAGVDVLIGQAPAAGGHSATLSPLAEPARIGIVELVHELRSQTSLPVIVAGGLATADSVADVIRAGATAAAVGTVLLRSDESGASSTYQAALADPARTETVVTHCFSGRPARGLRNGFIDTFDADAPFGYPAIHHLTSPLRKAAAAAGQPELVNLWAGRGYRHAAAESTADILRRLAARL